MYDDGCPLQPRTAPSAKRASRHRQATGPALAAAPGHRNAFTCIPADLVGPRSEVLAHPGHFFNVLSETLSKC